MFTSACSDVAANRQLDARGKALANRLLVEAETQGFPLAILTDPVEALAKIDWRQRYAQGLTRGAATQVEKQWTQPTGVRRWSGDAGAPGGLGCRRWRCWRRCSTCSFASSTRGTTTRDAPTVGWIHVFLPLMVCMGVLVILQLLIAAAAAALGRHPRRVPQAAGSARSPGTGKACIWRSPGDLATKLTEERQRVEKLVGEVHEVAVWLEQREQHASIAGLYGN